MNFDIENELRDSLNANEKILWTGRPKTGIAFRNSDIVVIPFSLMWCGFAIFWETMAFGSPAPFFFKLWGVPFVLVGLYMVIGRFFFDAAKRKTTVYGITDNRVIIKSGVFTKSVKSLNIKTISDLTFSEKKDQSGTITLGPQNQQASIFSGSNSWQGVKQAPALEMIENVKKVYSILIQQQRSA